MAPVLEWLLRNSHDPSAKSTAAITLNTTRACVRPMMTNICEEHKRRTIVFASRRRYESDRPKKPQERVRTPPTMAVTQISTSVLRR